MHTHTWGIAGRRDWNEQNLPRLYTSCRIFTPVQFFILTTGNIHAGTGIDVTLASLVLEPSAVILGATS